jgi:hypothetical protein
VGKHLPGKCEAQSSNSSTTKKNLIKINFIYLVFSPYSHYKHLGTI